VPTAPGLRLDSGVADGSEIGIHYDPMLAKLVAHAPTRTEAADLLAWALEHSVIAGVTTNRGAPGRVLRLPAFLAGQLDTHFLERHAVALAAARPRRSPRQAVTGRDVVAARARPRSGAVAGRRAGLAQRVVRRSARRLARRRSHALAVGYRHHGGRRFTADDRRRRRARSCSTRSRPGHVRWRIGELRRHRAGGGDGPRLARRRPGWACDVARAPRFPDRTAELEPGSVIAPMPGKVIKRWARRSATSIAAGTTLVVLEAMKMEQPVKTAVAGTVASIAVALGDQVAAEQVLAIVTPAE
jgi:propionyl-CoA carboxylase alpha chain